MREKRDVHKPHVDPWKDVLCGTFFPSHLFSGRWNSESWSPCKDGVLRPSRLGAGGPASRRKRRPGAGRGLAPAMYGIQRSVAASVFCKATFNKPHQRRSQPCFAAHAAPPQDGKNPLGSGPHQLSDEAEGLVAQRPPDSQARTQSRWVPARSSLRLFPNSIGCMSLCAHYSHTFHGKKHSQASDV